MDQAKGGTPAKDNLAELCTHWPEECRSGMCGAFEFACAPRPRRPDIFPRSSADDGTDKPGRTLQIADAPFDHKALLLQPPKPPLPNAPPLTSLSMPAAPWLPSPPGAPALLASPLSPPPLRPAALPKSPPVTPVSCDSLDSQFGCSECGLYAYCDAAPDAGCQLRPVGCTDGSCEPYSTYCSPHSQPPLTQPPSWPPTTSPTPP
eukprot:scaffold317860_cov24-Tisochrysis_lutea.AAC.1